MKFWLKFDMFLGMTGMTQYGLIFKSARNIGVFVPIWVQVRNILNILAGMIQN